MDRKPSNLRYKHVEQERIQYDHTWEIDWKVL
jgi:hypothetical protein